MHSIPVTGHIHFLCCASKGHSPCAAEPLTSDRDWGRREAIVPSIPVPLEGRVFMAQVPFQVHSQFHLPVLTPAPQPIFPLLLKSSKPELTDAPVSLRGRHLSQTTCGTLGLFWQYCPLHCVLAWSHWGLHGLCSGVAMLAPRAWVSMAGYSGGCGMDQT